MTLSENRYRRHAAVSFGCPSSIVPLSLPPVEEGDSFFQEIQILEGYSDELESKFLEKHTKETLTRFFGPLLLKQELLAGQHELPLVKTIVPTNAPGLLQIALLCEGSPLACGAGRHMADTFSQWLIPGNPLMITGLLGMRFIFPQTPHRKFFFCHLMIPIESKQELLQVQERLYDLIETVKRNITIVAYVRKILSKSSLSLFQQSALFLNFVHSLQSSDPDFDASLHDHAFELFRNALAQKKIEEVRQNLECHATNRRGFFDRDIFSEIQYFTWLYRARFIGKKDRAFVTKLISLQYLFRKHLKQQVSENSTHRHVTLKIFPLKRPFSSRITTLGLLVGINLIKEGEVFEDKHVLKAVQQLVSEIHLVPGSFIQDGRDTQKIRLFYLEIEKDEDKSFSFEELTLLRKQLARECKTCVETLIHPLFMPRNDEDLLRFSLQLCGQLADISAPPQMAIFFGNQNTDTLSFNVILAKVSDVHYSSSLLKELTHSGISLEIVDVETRRPPSSEKSWKKEVISFNAKIPKEPFLRADYTIDVLQARQEIVRQIQEALGFVRDYNGGLLETQLRAEQLFIASLGSLGKRELLLARAFFHAITPPLMQIILETSLLKKLYGMLLELYQNTSSLFSHSSTKRYEIVLLKSSPNSFKKEAQAIVQELDIPPSQISYMELKQGEEYFFALIHQNEGLTHLLLFEKLRLLLE